MATACSAPVLRSLLPAHQSKNDPYRQRASSSCRRQAHVGKLDVPAAHIYRHSNPLWEFKIWSDFGRGPLRPWQSILKTDRPQRDLHNSLSRPDGGIDTKVPAEEERPTTDRVECSDKPNGTHSSKFSDDSDSHVNPKVDELPSNLDAAVVEAVEIVAETVEVAAQTVSSVGEIGGPILEQAIIDQEAAVKTVVFWVCAAVACGLIIGLKDGTGKASEFFAGYLLEQSLSVDNLFVFVLIFKYFHVPIAHQGRVLTYGISGAILFRATMILLGVATLQRFEAVNLIFAGILLFTSYKLFSEPEDGANDLSDNFIVNTCKKFIPVTAAYDGNKFFTTTEGVRKATPLLLTLVVVECSDIAFAVDSIPAVFGVTRDPFIVFSSNIFAILGLRSLYTLVSGSMDDLDYLQPSIAVVLGFIGSKMVVDFFGIHLPTELSLGIVASVLGIGIGLSLWNKEKDD